MSSTFSHIYIEKKIKNHETTQRIISHFPEATLIEIDHYKDVFCRPKQNFAKQKDSQALILAQKDGELLYKGAKVCQSFGNLHFYYTSCIMNCIYNCEYCYLSGMYPSANIVMFINLEDYFAEVEKLLASHDMYICVSYDTDLLSLNHLSGFLNKWIEFTDKHENLKIEIRTKCGNLSSLTDTIAACKNKERIIFAYTLSPDEITRQYEHHTSSLKARVSAIKKLQELGYRCRIAFDPMIYVPNWKDYYSNLADIIFNGQPGFDKIDTNKLLDISIGSFRISSTYLKNMRKCYPSSQITQFPYQIEDGVYHYPDDILEEMENYLYDICQKNIPKEKIFLWKE